MIDRLFFAALTFSLMIGGTLAIGSEWFGRPVQHTAAASAKVRVVQLERVTITAKRLAPDARVARRDSAAEALLATRWQ